MNIYIPFTYIIGWSQHRQFYYGCKYAQGCHPSDLWESYFTSSKYVEKFRKEYGEPDIIKIHRTFLDKDSCVAFENHYLTKINAKDHPLFLNESNGGKDFNGSGADWTEKSYKQVKKTCIKKYGVDNPSKNEEIKIKKKETSLNNYGTENPTQSLIVKEKIKETNIEKYGVENVFESEEIKKQIKQFWMEKYGVEHRMQLEEQKENYRKTCLNRYGVDNVSKCEEIKEKKKSTHFSNYGTDNPFRKRENGSSLGRDNCLNMLENGTHPFLKRDDGSSLGKEICLRMLENGTHPFLKRDDGSSISSDRVKDGTCILLKRADGTSVASDRVKDGTHHFLKKNGGGKKNSERQKKKVENGTHNLVGSVTCYDKNGNVVQVPKIIYDSQIGEMNDREYVFINSKEGKRRKLLKNK